MVKTDTDYFAPEHARDAFADERRIVATGEPLLGKIERIRTADGESRWVASTKVAIKNKEDGHRLVGVSRDITELRQAEEALRLSEERYRGLFEGVPIGLYRTAPDGRILDANPAMVEMLGYPDRESLFAVNARDLDVNPADRAKAGAADARRGSAAFRRKMRRRDGTLIWVRDTARPIRAADGRLLRIEGSLEDITERKRLEEQFLQAQKMETVGRLAGGVAHDFNNLLTAIGGYAGLVKQAPSAGDPRRTRTSTRSSGRASAPPSLTRQLLAFSRRQIIEQQRDRSEPAHPGDGQDAAPRSSARTSSWSPCRAGPGRR